MVVLSGYPKNQHEFPGIHAVWKLAQKHSSRDDIILYFHSKGITRNTHPSCLRFAQIYRILRQYDECVAALDTFPAVNKCVVATDDGRRPQRRGFLGWYNFWYVRGSYAKILEKPIVTKDRLYYERWLAYAHGNRDFVDGETSDCYSLSQVLRYNVGEFWHPDVGYYSSHSYGFRDSNRS